jgi:4'-phosphopantetheinyl transferase EntD
MIETILPVRVRAAEEFGHPPGTFMFPEEQASIARAVPKRRSEFAAGRHCAHLALADLGCGPAPIKRADSGAPLWPAGVVGSITHCAGYAASAVGWARDVVALGIDAEPHLALPAGVIDTVALDEEHTELARLTADWPGVCWDRLFFSAKESVYKAWNPITGRWLGFKQAAVMVDADAGTFAARLLTPGPVVDGHRVAEFAGRWVVSRELILTSVVLAA